jgi:hypothetical protein
MAVPAVDFYRLELVRALAEVRFAVTGFALTGGARARIETVEGEVLDVECVNEGFRVRRAEHTRGGGLFSVQVVDSTSPSGTTTSMDTPTRPTTTTVYDTLDSLLINTSPGAMRAINERLAERLASLSASGGEGERQRWIGDE